MIYVEYHDGPEQTEAGRIDWQPGWYAICDDCGWMTGPYPTAADAHAAADAHDLAMGETTPQALDRDQQPSQRVEVAWQVSHGQRPDGWWFAVEIPGRPREEHGPYSSQEAMLTAKLARMEQLEAPPTSGRLRRGSGVPAAAKPSSSTWAACSDPPATAASPTAATRPGRARSAAAPATASRMAAAWTTGCASTSRDPNGGPDEAAPARHSG